MDVPGFRPSGTVDRSGPTGASSRSMTAERCRASQYALAARGSQANSIRVRLATLGSFGKWPRVRLSRPADPQRGESVYAMKCATCHSPDGQGRRGSKR